MMSKFFFGEVCTMNVRRFVFLICFGCMQTICPVSFGQQQVNPKPPVEEKVTEIETCFKAGTKACPETNFEGPCVDQECQPEGETEWICRVGTIGVYDKKTTYPFATPVESGGTGGFKGKVNIAEFVCHILKGCPTGGCVRTTDLDNPNTPIWYCSDPAQTGRKVLAPDPSDPSSNECPPPPPPTGGPKNPPPKHEIDDPF